MAKLNKYEIEDFYNDEKIEEIPQGKRRKQVDKQVDKQAGLVSTKISKITRDLIPSSEEKELMKTDTKRFKNR